MKDKKEFYKCIIDKRKIVKEKVSNCIGTALYLVGEIKKDKFIWEGREEIFNKLIKSKKPKLGYLVAWDNNSFDLAHAAVITGLNPLTIASREGEKGEFLTQYQIEGDKLCVKNHKFTEIKYFIPSKLQKILEKEELTK